MVRSAAVCGLAALVAVALVGPANGKAAKSCKEADVKLECAAWTGNVDTKEKCENGALARAQATKQQRGVCERVACTDMEDTYPDMEDAGLTVMTRWMAACYTCKGGEWGCPDFKIGKDTSTFKCDCRKKKSGSCTTMMGQYRRTMVGAHTSS